MNGYDGNKDDLQQRLRRIEGQVRGIARMVDGQVAAEKIREANDAIARLVRS